MNMSVGDAIANPKALDAAVERARRDHRSEADHHQGEEVDRGVQAARRYEHRREGDAARRAHVRLPRQALQHRAAAHPRLPRPAGASRSTGAATTTWVCASSSSFRRSTYDKVDKARGMDITIVTTAKTDEEASEFLDRDGTAVAEGTRASNGKDELDREVATRRRSSRCARTTAARSADARAAICASLRCAGSASARTRTRASSRA